MSQTRRTETCSRLALLGVVFVAGCGAAPPDDDPIGSTGEPIINGTVAAAGVAEAQGLVEIVLYTSAGTQTCSGTLIHNDMVLTARHCVEDMQAKLVTTAGAYKLTMGTQSATNSGLVIPHPLLDVALIQPATYLKMGASRFGWARNVYGGTDASLAGRSLWCYGYGLGSSNPATIGVLRTAILTVSSPTPTYIEFLPNPSGQIQTEGDSGGSCLTSASTSAALTGVLFGGLDPGSVSIGPEGYRDWLRTQLWNRSYSSIYTASSTTAYGDSLQLDHPDSNDASLALVTITPNWNPVGVTPTYENHNVGVWYDSSRHKWAAFNEDLAPMALGVSFNVSVGGTGAVHTVTSSNVSGHLTTLDIPAINGNPHAVLIVTPNWNGVYDDHPIGVWFNASSNRWTVYNEDLAAMPVGTAFNVRYVDASGGALPAQTATSANTVGNATVIDDARINGEPNARLFVTHLFDSAHPAYDPHPTGVFFNSSSGKWLVYTQDRTAMPIGAKFNVMIRP